MPTLGMQELLVVLAIAVLLFGGRKIPELLKGMGQGISAFRDGLKGEKKSDGDTEAD